MDFSLKNLKLQCEQLRRCQRGTLGSANNHNGVKVSNKRRGLVRPGLEDCSMHTNCTHPRAISQGFANTQRLASNSHAPHRGPIRRSCSLKGSVFTSVCAAFTQAINKPQQDQKHLQHLIFNSGSIVLVLLLKFKIKVSY